MSNARIYLKGGVNVSQGQDNRITKTTTWMYLTPNNTFNGWFATQAEVEEWAGSVGDPYREPNGSGVEITSYTSNPSFIVSDISINLVDRTHYEVTFTNVEATGLIYLSNGVQTTQDENGFITKTATWVHLNTTEDAVVAWAGSVGDNYRKPTPNGVGKLITEYTLDDSFIVTTIDISPTENNSYNVTFTHKQAENAVYLNSTQITYDENGFMVKNTTWTHHNTSEDVVRAWAGKIGDYCKTEDGTDSAFIVTSIDISESENDTYTISFTNTQAANLIYLRGGVDVSIDENGFITKTTTWVHHICDSSFLSIVGAQASVEEWAGNVGDPFRNPTANSGSLTTGYREDSAFIVSNISISMVDKTHYEVTFTNVQNTSVLKVRGNVSVNVSNTNEITKTINYVLNVPTTDGEPDYNAIDTTIISSGSVVDWAGSDFYVESSSYSASNATQYEISITAKDMSVMMIGLPSIKEDNFGQKTLTATWRYSKAAYEVAVLPKAGDPISDFFGVVGEGEYIITGVNANPDGVLGYTVEFTAKDVGKRVLQVSKEYRKGEEKTVKGGSLTYQGNGAVISEFSNLVGERLEDTPDAFSDLSELPVTSVNISQEGTDDFKITVDLDNQLNNDETEEKLSKDVSISMTQAKIYLTPQQCGYASNVSDLGYYPINNPPKTTIDRREAVGVYLDLTEDGKNVWTKDKLQNAIRNGKIGFDWITAVYDKDGKYIKRDKMSSVKIDDISTLLVTTYVYAQPHFPAFQPWVAKEQVLAAPVKNLSNLGKYRGTGLDLPLARRYINCGVSYMDCSVTMNYKGTAPKVVQNKWDNFFKYAKNKLKNSLFSSYKLAGIDVNGIKDSEGDDWTQVTTHIHVLMNGWYWNPEYGEGANVIND